MPLELVEDALGDPRNATALAVASDLAYLGPEAGPAAFREQLGMEAKIIAFGNTQVYVAQNDDHVVLAFRGTEGPTCIEGLKDWLLTDAVNLLILPEGRLGTDFAAAGVGARFHMGFVNALADVWEPLHAELEAELKRKERPLWITGHSLGGALALLAAWMCNRRFLNVHQIYTFGAPMVGNAAASEAFDKAFPNKIFRYVNLSDPVPKLPTMSLVANDYLHCSTEMTEQASGAAAEAVELFRTLASKAVNGILNATIIDDLWEAVRSRVSAHGLDSYRQLIEKLTGTK